MLEFIDLSVLVTPSLEVPSERLGPFQDPLTTFDRYVSDYDERGYIITRLDMGAHTGTHCDVPIHYRKDGASVADLPVRTFIGWAIIMDFYDQLGPISSQHLASYKHLIVGHDDVIPVLRHATTSPLSDEARRELISWRPKIVLTGEGCNPDDRFLDSKMFLEADIPLIMNPDHAAVRRLRSDDLIVALPLKLYNLEASPIRLIAVRGLTRREEVARGQRRLFGLFGGN